jgi:hypothetical protein
VIVVVPGEIPVMAPEPELIVATVVSLLVQDALEATMLDKDPV